MRRRLKTLMMAVAVLIMSSNPVMAKLPGDMTLPVVRSVIYVAQVRSEVEYLDNGGRQKMRGLAMKLTGVANSPQAAEMLTNVSQRLLSVLSAQGDNREYSFWLNPRNNFNAACFLGRNITVNLGALKLLRYDADMLAMLLAHEITHGKNQHIRKRVDSQITTELARQWFYAANKSMRDALLVDVATVQLMSGTSIAHEWEADNQGYELATAAGFNPGTGAAMWWLVLQKYGDRPQNFFGQLLSVTTHPTPSQRLRNFVGKLEAASGGRIRVDGNAVIKDGQVVETCSDPAQAYLAAGRLIKEGGYANE